MNSICVYCGSSCGSQPEYIDAAKQLGYELAKHNIKLIYGGASIGLMGAVADSVMAAGGTVIGVIPEVLVNKEVAHHNLTELRVVASMHERKSVMAELADGFIALPGGIGTLEELFEILTWAQLGLHQKPCGILNIDHYYDGLINFLNHAVDQEFLKPKHRGLLLESHQPDALIEQFINYHPPAFDKWLEKENT